jgi:hypothetical protein
VSTSGEPVSLNRAAYPAIRLQSRAAGDRPPSALIQAFDAAAVVSEPDQVQPVVVDETPLYRVFLRDLRGGFEAQYGDDNEYIKRILNIHEFYFIEL